MEQENLLTELESLRRRCADLKREVEEKAALLSSQEKELTAFREASGSFLKGVKDAVQLTECLERSRASFYKLVMGGASEFSSWRMT